MPIFEIETDQGVFEIDADREPTQVEALQAISGQLQAPTQLKASTQETIAASEAARQAITQSAQRGPGQKILEGVPAAISGIVNLAGRTLGGIPATVGLASTPEKILPTLGEAAERTVIDVAQLGQMLKPQSVTEALFGPAGAIFRGISNLRSRTPTEQEIASQIESAPLSQALSEIREEPLFEGAVPEAAETISQTLQLISPVKGAQLLKSGGKGLAAIPRNIRSAIKPRNAQLGARVEKATADEIADIFNANPNADKLTSIPLEGFQRTVGTLRQQVGKEIGDLAAQQQVPINAGDRISQRLLKEATDVENAGGAAEDVAFLRQRATEMSGRAVDIDSTQRAVTNANQELTPLYQRAIAAQNPGRANVSNIANKIIAEEGGSAINGVLEAIGGPRGAGLRKKWSNLVTLEREAGERVNKLINNAPPEIQSVAQQALTSVEGAVGLVGLLNGYVSGAIPLITSGAKSWAKKTAKELKDSNALIKRTYEDLRKNPPKATPAEAPPIPQISPEAPLPGFIPVEEQLSQQIARQLSGSTPIPIPISQIPLEEALARQFVPQRGIPGFNPIAGTQGLIDPSVQEALNAAIAQSLSTGRNVPRIFLPESP